MELRKNLAPNGLLTFSTPNQNYGRLQYCQELSAFNLYRSLLNYNSTPKNVSQTIRKPRVNFHSIDDIVNGGKINSGNLKLKIYYIFTLTNLLII